MPLGSSVRAGRGRGCVGPLGGPVACPGRRLGPVWKCPEPRPLGDALAPSAPPWDRSGQAQAEAWRGAVSSGLSHGRPAGH